MRLRFFALGLSLLLHGALLWYFIRGPLPARSPEIPAGPASTLAVSLVFSRPATPVRPSEIPATSPETALISKAQTQTEPPPKKEPSPETQPRPELKPAPAQPGKSAEAKTQIEPLPGKDSPPETKPRRNPETQPRPELKSAPAQPEKSPKAKPRPVDEKDTATPANTSGPKDNGHERVDESNASGKKSARKNRPTAFPPPAPASPAPPPVSQPPDRADEYRELVLRRVEQHKRYPPLARRRRLEGELQISLALDASGRIQALRVRGGHRLLRGAAEQAVKNALPFPPPWPGAGLPLNLDFKMIFRLQ